MIDLTKERILITGGHGFVGKHLVTALASRGVQLENLIVPHHRDADFKDPNTCTKYLEQSTVCIHLAALVGGIGLNRIKPADLFYDNIKMGSELIHQSIQLGHLKKFLMLGTVCSYPKYANIPFSEDELWDGYPEETNAPYGIAKKALLVYLQSAKQQYGLNSNFVMSTNMYGPGDNFSPESSHVIPALIKKFYEAKINNYSDVTLWGSGKATRDFLYVEDCAEGIVKALESLETCDPINLGSGTSISIKKVADLIKSYIEYDGEIVYDISMPDGQPKRQLNIEKARKLIDFNPKMDFVTGLSKTIDWYINNYG